MPSTYTSFLTEPSIADRHAKKLRFFSPFIYFLTGILGLILETVFFDVDALAQLPRTLIWNTTAENVMWQCIFWLMFFAMAWGIAVLVLAFEGILEIKSSGWRDHIRHSFIFYVSLAYPAYSLFTMADRGAWIEQFGFPVAVALGFLFVDAFSVIWAGRRK